MEKWKEKLEDLYNQYKKDERVKKIAVTALVVVAALVFFAPKGEKEEIVVEQSGESAQEEQQQQEEPAKNQIIVDIGGAVKTPGVYEIKEGARLFEVIQEAGGLLPDADTTTINQAEVLYDGQKIVIPQESEIQESGTGGPIVKPADGRININTADSTQLQEIPGVGPATAEKIIDYRDTNGRFTSVEELKNVSGIGEKTFEKMKDKVSV